MAGSGPNESAMVRRIAAPVGVTVSKATWAGTVGIPRSSSRVAGAGNGSRPCAVSTVPSPRATGEAVTRSMRSRCSALAAVHLSFRDRQRLEGGEGSAAHRLGQPCALDHPTDLGPVAAVPAPALARSGDLHEPGCERPAPDTTHAQAVPDAQSRKVLLELLA